MSDPGLFANPFLLPSLAAGALAGLACGVVGPYVVARRALFLAGAVAHIAVGGVGAAIYLRYRFPDAFGALEPIVGGLVAAVAAAWLLTWVEEQAGERLEVLIAALWSAGMALGLLLVQRTPGYATDLTAYLFGSLTLVGWRSVLGLAVLDAVILLGVVLYHRRFLAVCLDPEHARLQGLPIAGTRGVLLTLVALTTVALTRVVGLILVLALLALPAAAAGRLGRRLGHTPWIAVPLAIGVATLPRLAVAGSDVPPEPAIVLAAVAVYAVALLWSRRRRPAVRA